MVDGRCYSSTLLLEPHARVQVVHQTEEQRQQIELITRNSLRVIVRSGIWLKARLGVIKNSASIFREIIK